MQKRFFGTGTLTNAFIGKFLKKIIQKAEFLD
jgi:hypothetical protein